MKAGKSHPMILIAGGLTLAIVVWFYGFVPRFGFDGSLSVFGWLMRAWDDDTTKFAPLLILGLIGYRIKDLRAATVSERCSFMGLIAVFFGAMFYVISQRFSLPRIAAYSLPLLLWGACHFLWGWKVAKILVFPVLLLWLVVPSPRFHHAASDLLPWVVSLAHHVGYLFGIETKATGLVLTPMNGELEPIFFGMGCSNGMPDLLALLMISAGWAYIAQIRLWQKALLFLSALPIAIFVNALRLVSILVVADKGDARWATTTWYDWSDLVLVYPLSLLLFLALHSMFTGGLPWKTNAKSGAARG